MSNEWLLVPAARSRLQDRCIVRIQKSQSFRSSNRIESPSPHPTYWYPITINTASSKRPGIYWNSIYCQRGQYPRRRPTDQSHVSCIDKSVGIEIDCIQCKLIWEGSESLSWIVDDMKKKNRFGRFVLSRISTSPSVGPGPRGSRLSMARHGWRDCYAQSA